MKNKLIQDILDSTPQHIKDFTSAYADSLLAMGDSFHERKKHRKEYFEKFIKGWKLKPCTACNGSGYYDHNGSPKCTACKGTGKEKYKPEENKK